MSLVLRTLLEISNSVGGATTDVDPSYEATPTILKGCDKDYISTLLLFSLPTFTVLWLFPPSLQPVFLPPLFPPLLPHPRPQLRATWCILGDTRSCMPLQHRHWEMAASPSSTLSPLPATPSHMTLVWPVCVYISCADEYAAIHICFLSLRLPTTGLSHLSPSCCCSDSHVCSPAAPGN